MAAIDGVVAVVLGGSRALGVADQWSDVDLGIFYEPARPPGLSALRALARELDDRHPDAAVTDFGEWGPWINGGGWLTVRGVRVDWLYRDLWRVAQVLDECEAGRPVCAYQAGYPHGFHSHIYLAEVHHGRALSDRAGAFAALQARTEPYPGRLADALVRRYLWEAAFMLDNAGKPARRGDVAFVAGCLYRTTACLVQVLFALNRRYFLHEKRAVEMAAALPRVPPRFAETVSGVLAARGATAAALLAQVARLTEVLDATRALAAEGAGTEPMTEGSRAWRADDGGEMTRERGAR